MPFVFRCSSGARGVTEGMHENIVAGLESQSLFCLGDLLRVFYELFDNGKHKGNASSES